MVGERLDSHAGSAGCRGNAPVALDRTRFVVDVIVQCAGVDALREGQQLVGTVALEQRQIAAFRAQSSAQFGQRIEKECDDRVTDVGAAQERWIEHESADDPVAGTRRTLERDVIVEP